MNFLGAFVGDEEAARSMPPSAASPRPDLVPADSDAYQVDVARFHEELAEGRLLEAGAVCQALVTAALQLGDVEREIAQHCSVKFSLAAFPVAAAEFEASNFEDGTCLISYCASCGQAEQATTFLTEQLCVAIGKASTNAIEDLKSLHSIARLAGAGRDKGSVVETSDPYPYVTVIRNILQFGGFSLDLAPCPGLSPRQHEDVMEAVVRATGKYILETLRLFRSGKRLTQWEMHVRGNAEMPRHAQAMESDELRRSLDGVLVECAVLCGEVNKFLSYANELLRTVHAAVREGEGAAGSRARQEASAAQDVEIEVQEILCSFIVVEQYCVAKSMNRAVEVSELDVYDKSIQVSSLVDDTFFIAQSSFERSLLAMYEFGVISATNHIKVIMEDMLMVELSHLAAGKVVIGEKPLGSTAAGPSSVGHDTGEGETRDLEDEWSKALGSFLDEEDEGRGREQPAEGARRRRRAGSMTQVTPEQMVVALNSAHAAAHKTGQFKDYAQTKFQSLFDGSQKLEPFMEEMNNLKRRFQNLCDSGIEYIIERFMSYVKSTVRESLLDADYVVNSFEEHESRSVNDNYATKFVNMLNASGGLVARCRETMPDETFTSLLQCLASEFAAVLLRVYKSKRYNELGALTLQAEVRTILDGINSLMTTGSVRSQLGNLQAFVWLLNVEHPKEVLDNPILLKSSTLQNEPGAIQSILRLRVEDSFLRAVDGISL